MGRTAGGRTSNGPATSRPARFVRMSERDSRTAQLLHDCPVVMPEGDRIGYVDHLMADAATRQLRYVIIRRRRYGGQQGAMVAIPWHVLYFDAAHGRLVFYTWG